MAHFIATIRGNRGESSRLGSPTSGIFAHPRGWNLGVRVEGHVQGTQDDGGNDAFDIDLTTGSSREGRSRQLARVYRDDATGGWLVDLVRPDGATETLTYPD